MSAGGEVEDRQEVASPEEGREAMSYADLLLISSISVPPAHHPTIAIGPQILLSLVDTSTLRSASFIHVYIVQSYTL
jgi:hypothetical protein